MIIKGNTVGTTMPRANWDQEDPKKADYIKGRDVVNKVLEDASNHILDEDNPHGVTPEQIGAQEQHIHFVVSLPTSGWSNNSQTVTANHVTANNTLIVASAPENYDAYSKAGVYCSAQAVGSLTFTCKSVPTANLNANVMILT